ncbi:hypothetical protein [Poritiphilus flavus]|uniref:Uncharacterized protein n=1 Tax=Poritiphilus flavus TaxID=2697053 RepID=A0A6L9EEN6_9FLAO|nr:hypothetical protein [Poritiphilus flavus]NAS13205.1 hypothetical protein [Poritiphilus flavus]
MNKTLFAFIGVVLLALLSCETRSNTEVSVNEWILVYRNDRNGNALYGDKQKLIDAVRNGLPIRVGFGGRGRKDSTRSVEHLTEAKFLTITNNREVFAQVPQILGQLPFLADDSLKIQFRPENKWVKICGTNGYSTGLMVDFINDSLVSPGVDGRAGTSWFVQIENIDKITTADPLWD